ncbi:phosphoribosylaminoimidazolesuccinocarboxamide synthase [Candidatus Peregrinibacteria bacterium RIFOXYB2_FULL_32_7]|nr:MAG: phosphoribosylaminoimidazolesuccinocarboxamide synthase [Candidatus Peregrinibacteria bacterium RIFOXYB2_FULL_32_7]
MLSQDQIKAQLVYVLKGTNFPWLGEKYEGKIRDNYTKGDRRILIVTDKVSAFDRVLGYIPFKGQVLNQMAKFWFDETKDICGNHAIEFPDPNAVVAKQCKALPVEMVVRGYITGTTSTSAWTHYKNGERNFCGNQLPEGLKKDQKFDYPIITPSTKAEHGDHDESVSPQEILDRNLVTKEQLDFLMSASMALYKKGVEIAAKQGIILVDTKYEFGIAEDGNIILIDEIHTPDSSRFWKTNTYQQNFSAGKEQDNINKEYLRIWLANQGYTGDGPIPEIPEDVICETSRRYIEAFELITGQTFSAGVGDVLSRVEANLKKFK